MNTFDRVKLSALQAAFSGAAFDISAPVAGLGRPLDWVLFNGSFISSVNSGVRKAGANKIVVTQLGADNGFKDVACPTISFTDGNGPASGNQGGLGHIQTAQTIGNGMRYEVTVGSLANTGRWPDALQLRVLDITFGFPRQVSYAASIQGDPDAVAYTEHIGPPNQENGDFTLQSYHVTDLVFASERPGTVARLDLTRNALSMGNWVFAFVALYRAPIVVLESRGANNALIGTAQ